MEKSESETKEKTRPYIAVNVPREWEQYLKELLDKPQVQKELAFSKFSKTYSGLGCWIIRKHLLEETRLRDEQTLPRLEQINCDENGVKVWDRELRKLVEISLRPQGILCNICNTDDCLHIQFALSQSNTRKQVIKRRKEGWKLPEV